MAVYIIIILCLIAIIIAEHQHNIKIDTEAQNELDEIQAEIDRLVDNRATLSKEIEQQEQQIETEKARFTKDLDEYKKNASNSATKYFEDLKQEYDLAKQKHEVAISALENQEQIKQDSIAELDSQISKLQNTLDAGARAQLREQEKEQQLDFYKLSVTKQDKDDIETLEKVKLSLHNPVVLSKLIWTTYFQKQTVELCNRVLGTDKVCGIYKITDLNTQQCYIGQSSNVFRRWQEHIRRGLGIDTPSSNKLYQAMQEDGVWNFTFELLESCPKDQLDEKEKLWIDMFGAATYGLNTSHGNGVKI